MSLKLMSVKCPECGAGLPIEKGQSQIFCSYCGAKVVVVNENEYTYRHIDEAEVKKAEADRAVRLRELEIEEKQREKDREENAKRTRKGTVGFLVWTALTGLFFLIEASYPGFFTIAMLSLSAELWAALFWLTSNEERKKQETEEKNRSAGLIELDISMDSLNNKPFFLLENELRAMGFNNIQCISLKDIRINGRKEGKVETISINGKTVTKSGGWYHSDAPIIISYHGR